MKQRNAIRLIKTETPRRSKFGGRPNLPESCALPVDPQGRELEFLAQIDFSELPPGTELPERGTLFVFYDSRKMPHSESDVDESGYWRVIFTDEPLPESPRAPLQEEIWTYKEFFLNYKVLRTSKNFSAPHHQLLGRPFWLQHRNMAPGYRLLLQLDSDWGPNGPCWSWCDCGILYFFIKPEDFDAGRFDKVMVMWECC